MLAEKFDGTQLGREDADLFEEINMANSFKLQRDPKSGIFYIHWTEHIARGRPGRSKRQSTGTADQREAQKFLSQFLAIKSTGGEPTRCPVCGSLTSTSSAANGAANVQAPPAAADSRQLNGSGVPIVGKLWAIYVERHAKRNTVAPKLFDKSWDNLEPHFGALRVSEVSQEVVEKYEGKRRRGTIGRPSIAGTIRRELVLLRACFNWCASPKRKILKPEEVPVFDLPPDSEPSDRWLRTEEIDKLKEVAAAGVGQDGRMSRGERFLWLGLETAGRSEAIRQLTWDRIDWEIKTIDFNVPGRRRTKKRRAVVPISHALWPILRRMYEERANNYVLDTDSEVGRLIDRIADRAGVADVSPHVLRHTAATHMARRGVPFFIIAKILGNSVALAERVYAKHQPDDLRAGVDRISEGATTEDLSATPKPRGTKS